MNIFNFWKKEQRNNTKELSIDEKIQQNLEDLGNQISDELKYIDINVNVNSYLYDDYVAAVILPQYTPLQTEKEIDLKINLIRDFKQNPQQNSDSRMFLLSKHFIGPISSFIDYDELKNPSHVEILNDLQDYLNRIFAEQSKKLDKNFYGHKKVDELQKDHVDSLQKVMALVEKCKLDYKGNPLDYDRMLYDSQYREYQKHHLDNIFKGITTPMATLTSYISDNEYYYRKAQIKMAIRQRAVVSISSIFLYIQAIGNHYEEMIKKEDLLTMHEWLHLCFPEQWSELLKTYNMTSQQVLNSDNPEKILMQIRIPESWKQKVLEHINKFVDDCVMSYSHFYQMGQQYYLKYKTDVMVCSNLSRILHSAYFDKRSLNFLLETQLNVHYTKILEKIANGYCYNERELNPHLHGEAILSLEQIAQKEAEITNNFIEVAERRLVEAQKALEELKKKEHSLTNWKEYTHAMAFEDVKKATFKSYRELEYSAINYMGRRELYIYDNEFATKQLTDEWFVNYNRAHWFNKLKESNHEYLFVSSDYFGKTFIRFFNIFNNEQKKQILNAVNTTIAESARDLFYLDFLLNPEQTEVIGSRVSVCNNNTHGNNSMLEYSNHNAVKINLLLLEPEPFILNPK